MSGWPSWTCSPFAFRWLFLVIWGFLSIINCFLINNAGFYFFIYCLNFNLIDLYALDAFYIFLEHEFLLTLFLWRYLSSSLSAKNFVYYIGLLASPSIFWKDQMVLDNASLFSSRYLQLRPIRSSCSLCGVSIVCF